MPSNAMQNVDVDEIWNTLGRFGKYQWKQLLSYLFICVSWAIHQLSLVFIGYRPEFHCRAPENTSLSLDNDTVRVEYKECSIDTYMNTSSKEIVTSAGCIHGWEYGIPTEQSFVTEWDFVCSNDSLAELSQTLLIVGMMLGTFVCPTLSDKVGRKPIMVFSHVALFVIVMATAFSPNYYVFIVFRVLTGAVTQGALSGTTLALETFPKEIRHYTEVLALTMWTTAICIMSPIAYLFRNTSWRYLQITYAMFSAWSIFQWWILDESLRWVIANGQMERAKQIIRNACKWNKKSFKDVLDKVGLGESSSELAPLDSPKMEKNAKSKDLKADHKMNNGVPKYSVTVIVRKKHIARVSFILWYTWMVDSLVYYGLYMISSDLYGNRYINFFLSALIEYPAAAFEYFCLVRIGRKWTCVICHLIATLGLIIATILTYSAGGNEHMLAAGTAFTLIGKMGITGAFSTSYIITPELYPTNLRNTGLGVSSFMGKLGGMIAPFSRNVSHTTRWLPGAIYSVLCIVTVFLFAFVPETNGVELPQTLEELSEWYKVNKFEMKFGKNKHVKSKASDDVLLES